MAELVMEYFAPTQIYLTLDPTKDSRSLYQRFAFLYAQIKGTGFRAAMSQIIARPHREWVSQYELGKRSQPVRPDRSLIANLARSPKRRPIGNSPGTSLTSLSWEPLIVSTIQIVDTAENRFIKFALERWVTLVRQLKEVLVSSPNTYRTRRGLVECDDALDILHEWLSTELFMEVTELTLLPLSSPVLSRQDGYRDIFERFLAFELAGRIFWPAMEDIYAVGQRDIATLYEYWVFLHLVKLITSECESYELGNLVEQSPNGLEFTLSRGRTPRLTASCNRYGRRINLELTFNRRFVPTSTSTLAGTWSRPLQPDYSVCITLEPSFLRTPDVAWIHFDAKYRVEQHIELFSAPAASDNDIDKEIDLDNESRRLGHTRREDLYKMHTYLDAVKRTAGSYVIYPGTEETVFHRGPEVLPGIGAFPLRPTETGEAEGAIALKSFFNGVLDHLGLQSTILERTRYWCDLSAMQLPVAASGAGLGFLRRPPTDTTVLLVYEDSEAVHEWVESRKLVMLPGDSEGSIRIALEEFGFEFVCMFGADGIVGTWEAGGTVQLFTRIEVEALRFPGHTGEVNLAFGLTNGPLGFVDVSVDTVKRCLGDHVKVAIGFSRVVTVLDLIGQSPPVQHSPS